MSESATATGESANSDIVPSDRDVENELFFGASGPKCQSAKVTSGYTHTVAGVESYCSQAVAGDKGTERDDGGAGHSRRKIYGEADPQAFGRLLDLIADREVMIWFEGAALHWQASDDAVDAELLRLLRRFKGALRQAWGPDRLPPDEPEEGSQKRRRQMAVSSPEG